MSVRETLVRFRSFWIFPLLATVLLYATFSNEPHSQKRDLLWLIPLGGLLWTLIEYALHRFVFHVEIQNPRLRELVNASHLTHHDAPRDGNKLLVHPSYALVISAVLYGALYLIFGGLSSAMGVMTGIWAGFLYYESVHYRVHMTATNSAILARQRRAHFYHHFTNKDKCFGVTSPLWDYVFGTARLKTEFLS